MDYYEQLRQILDTHPSGAPKAEVFDEILRILYRPEEVALLIRMSFTPLPPEEIAVAADLSPGEALPMLESLADRALVFSREKGGKREYGLLPTIPGLFEFPFMRGGGPPILERLGRLWEDYHREGLGEAFAGQPTPLTRVIPVEKSLDTNSYVYPYEEVVRIIAEADYLALAHCACRVSVGACDAPREACIIFGPMGRFLVQRGYAREIGREEAHQVLDRAEAAGLVHMSNNSADRANLICNCCTCCCTILRGQTQLHLPHAFAPSAYGAVVVPDACTGCGVCADERCPMKAIEMQDNLAVVAAERCIGCGLCVAACPVAALALVRREEAPEIPATSQEMALKILKEKGKLEDFLLLMKKS